MLIDHRGGAHFWRLMREMRTSHPDDSQLIFIGFDRLFVRGLDLRGLPLLEWKKDLHRLCARSKVPFLKEMQTFPDGALLYEHCDKFGFEGVVSKRSWSRYVSGLSRYWTKVKCPGRARDHAEPGARSNAPKRQNPTVQKQRERETTEFARVVDKLASGADFSQDPKFT